MIEPLAYNYSHYQACKGKVKKKSIEPFKIFSKSLKVENYPKNIMGVTFGKMLVLGIAKMKINKTFMALKHEFKTHFC